MNEQTTTIYSYSPADIAQMPATRQALERLARRIVEGKESTRTDSGYLITDVDTSDWPTFTISLRRDK